MNLTVDEIFEILEQRRQYLVRHVFKSQTQPVEVWLLWMEEYMNELRKALTLRGAELEVPYCLRSVLAVGLQCTYHHGLPTRDDTSHEMSSFNSNAPALEAVKAAVVGELEYAKKWDANRPPWELEDKDKPMEAWVLWMEEYLSRARAANTEGHWVSALHELRKMIGLGVSCARYHGIPRTSPDGV